jgi:hypothetical protein
MVSAEQVVITNRSISVGGVNIGRSANTGSIVIDGNVIQGADQIYDSGKEGQEHRVLPRFDEVVINISADVTIQAGREPDVTIKADEAVIPLITTSVENGRLIIDPKRSFATAHSIDIEIGAPHVVSVSLQGSGDIELYGVSENRLVLKIDGSGDFKAAGNVDRLVVKTNGNGSLRLRQLITRHADISIDGSGDADVFARESLSAQIDGSGNIVYYGSPHRVNKRVNGVGEIIAGS